VATSERFKALLESLRPIIDAITQDLEAFAANLPAAFEGLDFSGLVQSLIDLQSQAGDTFAAFFKDLDLSTVEGLQGAIQRIIGALENLNRFIEGQLNAFEVGAAIIGDFFRTFAEADPQTIYRFGEAVGSLAQVNLALDGLGKLTPILTGLVSILGGALIIKAIANAGLFSAAVTGLGATTTAAALAITPFQAALAGVATFFATFQLGNALAELTGLDDVLQRVGDSALDFFYGLQSTEGTSDAVAQAMQRLADATGNTYESLEDARQAARDGEITWQQYYDALGLTAAEQAGLAGSTKDLAAATEAAASSTDGIQAGLTATAQAAGTADGEVSVLRGTMLSLATDDRFKNMEFAVDLDIANVEADATVAKAALESIGETSSSVSELLGKLFGMLTDENLSSGDLETIRERILKLSELQDRQLEANIELTEQMAEYYAARADFLAKENALIKIEGDGLQPHLEAFMWEILEQVQTRVNEQGLEFLVGTAA
jgi:hypothetical protein